MLPLDVQRTQLTDGLAYCANAAWFPHKIGMVSWENASSSDPRNKAATLPEGLQTETSDIVIKP